MKKKHKRLMINCIIGAVILITLGVVATFTVGAVIEEKEKNRPAEEVMKESHTSEELRIEEFKIIKLNEVESKVTFKIYNDSKVEIKNKSIAVELYNKKKNYLVYDFTVYVDELKPNQSKELSHETTFKLDNAYDFKFYESEPEGTSFE